jgi:hypothetical protein
MSFFYMKDLVTLVTYYIKMTENSLLKEANCSYINSYKLIDIANIINSLSDYKVPIHMDINTVPDYESKLNVPYNNNYIGIHQGIFETYQKLKS